MDSASGAFAKLDGVLTAAKALLTLQYSPGAKHFQAKYGLGRVCLLHEDGVNIPSNIGGLVHTPFTKGNIAMTYGLLLRELKAFYRR